LVNNDTIPGQLVAKQHVGINDAPYFVSFSKHFRQELVPICTSGNLVKLAASNCFQRRLKDGSSYK
jgi:hypothetical protein